MAVPAPIPVKLPEVSIVAVPVPATTLQIPPVVPSAKVMVLPVHNVADPVMAAGATLTVTVSLVKQPCGKV